MNQIIVNQEQKQIGFKRKFQQKPIENINNIKIKPSYKIQGGYLIHQRSKSQSEQKEDTSKNLLKRIDSGTPIRKASYDKQDFKNILIRADEAFQMGDMNLSIDLYKKAIILHPQNINIQFNLAKCYFLNKNYKEAKFILCTQFRSSSQQSENYFYLSAKVHQYYKQIRIGIQILNQGLGAYPQSILLLRTRAQLYYHTKQYQNSHLDIFNLLLQEHPDESITIRNEDLLLQKQCYYKINDFESSLKIQSLIEKYDQRFQFIDLKSKYQKFQYVQVLNEIKNIDLDVSPNYKVIYLKAKTLKKQQNFYESYILFEYVANNTFGSDLNLKSLYQIIKLHIQNQEFQMGLFTSQRLENVIVENSSRKFKKYKQILDLMDAIYKIIKNQCEEGISKINQLLKYHQITKFVEKYSFVFRAYARFIVKDLLGSFQDYQICAKLNFFSISDKINSQLCEALLASKSNQFEKSLDLFINTIEEFPESNFFSAVINVQLFCETKGIDKYLHKAMEFLEKFENTQSLFLIGLIYFFQNDIDLAFQQFYIFFQEPRDFTSNHFYAYGLLFCVTEQLDQAIIQFTESINYYPLVGEAYLERAKCQILIREKEIAYQDIDSYLQECKSDDKYQEVALFFLCCRDYSNAQIYFNQAIEIQFDEYLLLYRFYSYLGNRQLFQCQQCIIQILSMKHLFQSQDFETLIKFDMISLQALDLMLKYQYEEALIMLKSVDQDGFAFKQADNLQYQAVCQFYLQNYDESQNLFVKSNQLEKQIPWRSVDYMIMKNQELQYNSIMIMIQKKELVKVRMTLDFQINELWAQKLKQELNDESTHEIKFNPIFLSSAYQPQDSNQNHIIKLWISFDVPELDIPLITFQFDKKLLLDININQVQIQPNAPWFKRNHNKIIFTNNIYENRKNQYQD